MSNIVTKIKLPILMSVIFFVIAACAAPKYSNPSDLRFQVKNEERNQLVRVTRDNKLCDNDIEGTQNCPINFYIDSILSGVFYTDNSADYYLKPEKYILKVKSCTGVDCQACDITFDPKEHASKSLLLTLDGVGRPLITSTEEALVCK